MRYCTAVLFALTLAAAGPQPQTIALRDGTQLPGRLTLPSGKGPFPTIFVLTLQTPPPEEFLKAGYAVLQAPPRIPSSSEDGVDVLKWIASQSWSDGKVGIYAWDASAHAAYLAVVSGAPQLKAAVIHNGYAGEYGALFPGGVFQSSVAAPPPPDLTTPYFQRFDGRTESGQKVEVPVLHFTSWFHVFHQQTIDAFNAFQTGGRGLAKGNQKLIVQPVAADPARIGEMPVSWFDLWLQGKDNSTRKMPAVQFALLDTDGGHKWKATTGWPPDTNSVSYYLQPEGGLSRTAPTSTAGSSSYDYDPRDPVPSVQTRKGDWTDLTPADQRVLSDRADILRFTSRPRTENLEIAGEIRAELFVSTTARDTDFFVRLLDIHPDGRQSLLASQPMRLRFREGFHRMLPAQRNKVYKLEITLGSLAITIPRGHRIGVQVTSSDAPRFDRHTNTWDPVKDLADAVKASNTVHYSTQYPSRILLPQMKR